MANDGSLMCAHTDFVGDPFRGGKRKFVSHPGAAQVKFSRPRTSMLIDRELPMCANRASAHAIRPSEAILPPFFAGEPSEYRHLLKVLHSSSVAFTPTLT